LPPTLLGWDLRLRLARLLLVSGHVAAAPPVLAAAPAFPDSGWVAAQAAELVARLPLGDPLRSRELAALELAWRREPLSEEIRRRYREAWWQQSRWTAVVPVNGLQVGAQQWLDIQPPQESARAESGALWALGPGQTVKVSSRPSPGAQALLRAFVVPPAQGTAPLALHVGTQPLALPGVDPVEPVEVALPPGEHALRLEGPPSTRAFLSLAPAEGSAAPDVAYVRTHWPLAAASGGLRFRIPDPQLPAPVRVQLRATGDSRAPVTVRVHTDVGPSQRLVLRPAGTNASHLALDGSARPSAAAGSGVVMLPPLTREVRLVLEKGSAPVAASLAVRRDLHADVEAPGAQRAFAAPAQPVEELLSLSRQLVDQPQSAPFLLARAELLLALGEEGLARADLGRLTRLQEPLSAAETQQFKSLAAQLDSERGEVRFGEPISAPTLIAPAFPGLAGAQSPAVRALATAARERGAKAALARPPSGAATSGASPAERYLRARLQARAGEVDAAALQLVQLYRETAQPQVGLEALALFAQLPPTSPTWTEGGAPLGSALAAKLEGWADLPLVRRMRNSAGRWTQWERLRDAEQAAGRLEALQRGAPQERAELVRKALLAPPWPLEEARLLTAGRASVLELETGDTQRLGAQVQCSPALLESADVGAEGPPAPCNFTLRVDGRTELEQQVPAGASALLAAPLRAAGRHQLELLLAQEGTGRQ
ncbi:MAG TPA: hypothetical protein VFO83_01435, partial [Aggregicoccus sp.]|nr:hypothetical protein [Aggregicoccus sp.]